jgi:hypothetical protein
VSENNESDESLSLGDLYEMAMEVPSDVKIYADGKPVKLMTIQKVDEEACIMLLTEF